MCAVLGDSIAILPGLVLCSENGDFSLPVQNTGETECIIGAGQIIGTFLADREDIVRVCPVL